MANVNRISEYWNSLIKYYFRVRKQLSVRQQLGLETLATLGSRR